MNSTTMFMKSAFVINIHQISSPTDPDKDKPRINQGLESTCIYINCS